MSQQWRRSAEGGSGWLMGLYVWAALHLGRGFANLWLLPTTGYFLLTRGRERRASRVYLEKALGRAPRLADVWRHFRSFAQVTSDRVFLLSARHRGLDLNIEGVEQLGSLLDDGKGCILLGSHLGSFEAARVVSELRPDVSLRILMDRSHNPKATRLLQSLNPQFSQQIIDTGQEQTQVALRIGEALKQGELVAMLGDRVMGNDRSVAVDFLGHPAHLPISPYLIARMTGAPIMLFFALYLGGGHYRIVFERLGVADATQAPREQVVKDSARAYAQRLSHYARQAPYNWFNFYPFWENPGP